MTLEEKLRESYGDEHLEYLAAHYPRQFEYVLKVARYFHEQNLQRDQANSETGELPAQTGGQEHSVD